MADFKNLQDYDTSSILIPVKEDVSCNAPTPDAMSTSTEVKTFFREDTNQGKKLGRGSLLVLFELSKPRFIALRSELYASALALTVCSMPLRDSWTVLSS